MGEAFGRLVLIILGGASLSGLVIWLEGEFTSRHFQGSLLGFILPALGVYAGVIITFAIMAVWEIRRGNW